MSKFEVLVVDVAAKKPIFRGEEEAANIELVVVFDYLTIIKKDSFRKGDKGVYIPADAVLPEWLIEKLGAKDYLRGPGKNVVKPIKLWSTLSEGILAPMNILPEPSENYAIGQLVTDQLGIVKYEVALPGHLKGTQARRPTWMPTYHDIDNFKKCRGKFEKNIEPDEEIVVTEKIHGMNFSAGYKKTEDGEEFAVSSHSVCREESDKDAFWQLAKKYKLKEVLADMSEKHNLTSVVLFGERYGHGVQDLWYGADKDDVRLIVFDIFINGRYVDFDKMLELIAPYSQLQSVPILYRGLYNKEKILELTSGKTALIKESTPHIREGVVFRTVKEKGSHALSRMILKSISDDYLTRKNKPTEYK